ncbi:exocyst complex subunit 5 [Heterostelium album PN500]|uniref:Exocyst complex subunit 5 n=1 Tax=Heterostelium pallidum (strain ATCC 26659 / Pp 5 / PN500) TaxID=670386 RepID=D3BSJ2_HETP5|nr:exocyst complex subunit 5 [Heterostelium album PN500]EFA75457.1 exocyst complex subunit 5 [Heterostelium album PN500]|eukprot:XP_020427591.1 exocyst complex subunit 5 [Heterostelium album PN500]
MRHILFFFVSLYNDDGMAGYTMLSPKYSPSIIIKVMSNDNKEQQDNEIIVISSMYTSLKCDDSSKWYTLLIRPDSDEQTGGEATDSLSTSSSSDDLDSLIHFTFSYQGTSYPSDEPPLFNVKSASFLAEHCELLNQKLRELWSPNEPVIFQAIQWLQTDAIPTLNQYIESQHASRKRNIYHQNKQQDQLQKTTITTEDKQQQQPRRKTPTIYTGQAVTDKKSRFQAHLAIVYSSEDVELVLDKLYTNKKIADATHNMYAYRIKMNDGQINEYYNDDGEAGAGDKMLFTLIKNECDRILIVVTRWFGGILLYFVNENSQFCCILISSLLSSLSFHHIAPIPMSAQESSPINNNAKSPLLTPQQTKQIPTTTTTADITSKLPATQPNVVQQILPIPKGAEERSAISSKTPLVQAESIKPDANSKVTSSNMPPSSSSSSASTSNVSPPLKSAAASSNVGLATNSFPTSTSKPNYMMPQQKIQQKQLTSDMFKGVDFTATQFVEDLTRKLVNDQMGSDGMRFDPVPFNTLFLETQIKLSQLESNIDSRLNDLVDECNQYAEEYKQKLHSLHKSYQEAFQYFRELERGVNTIGAQAVHFGDELDSVTQQKNKAQSALSLINYLLELNNENNSSQRSDIFTNSERIHELAQLVKKLSSVSEDIKEITILNKGKSEAESLTNTLENDLISQFERAQDRGDYEKMKQCATTLYDFNGGARCRATYVQKLKMFFDVASLRADENMAHQTTKRVIRKNVIVKDPRFKQFFSQILKDVTHEQNVIQAVFINQTSAMAMLITRIFEQRVKSFIDSVLLLEKTNLSFLQTLHIAYLKTKKKLVEPLASFGIHGIDFNGLLSSIFFPYQDGYINRELRSLEDILQGLVMEDSEMNEEGLNQEFTQTLIQQTEYALVRCLPLSPELNLGENIKAIFFLMLRGLCTDYIENKLDSASRLYPATDSRCLSTLNSLFMIILNVNQVVGQIQTQYQLYVSPLINQTNIQSQCSEQLHYNISSMEIKICKALESSLTTMVGLIDKSLLDQKRNDYLSEDYDNSVTPTCTAIIKLIHILYDLCKSCLQGKNLTIFTEELGLKIQFAFINHFKKFKIGQGPGALKLLSDLKSYKDASKIFKSHKVEESFDMLYDISKLHFVNAENFKSVIEGGALSRMPKADLIAFIKQRSDFKSLWLDML